MVNSPRYPVSSREPRVNEKVEEVRASEQRSGEEKERVRAQMERTMHRALAKCCERTEKCEEFGCCSSGCQHS